MISLKSTSRVYELVDVINDEKVDVALSKAFY